MRPSYYGSGVWVEPFYLNPVVWFAVALVGLLAFIALK